MAKIRKEKIQEEIRRKVGNIFVRELSEAKIGFVTVTKVKCSSDLTIAKIYLSIFDNNLETRNKKLQKIIKLTPRVRGLLGSKIRIRYIPQIRFYLDDSLDYVEKIDRLINEVHKQEKDNEHTDI